MKLWLRLGLVGLVVASLAAILWQNASAQYALTFLGMRSQPLSLGLLVLLAVGAGSASGLFLLTCLRLAHFFAQQAVATADPSRQQVRVEPPPPSPLPNPAVDDEWDIETPPAPWSSPKAGPWPEPEAPIYDADYRVLHSPGEHQPRPPEDDWLNQETEHGFDPEFDQIFDQNDGPEEPPPRRRSAQRRP